jgi:hypothetical protein
MVDSPHPLLQLLKMTGFENLNIKARLTTIKFGTKTPRPTMNTGARKSGVNSAVTCKREPSEPQNSFSLDPKHCRVRVKARAMKHGWSV